MADDPRLQELLDKQEIHELLVRWCRGLDRGDAELMGSVYHDDATDIRGTRHFDGKNAAADYVERHWEWKRHMHYVTNTTIDVDGDVATSESYLFSTLVREEDGIEKLYQYGGRNFDRLERRNGTWKIAHRRGIYDWRVVSDLVPNQVGATPFGAASMRSKDDPSYRILEDLPS